MERRNERGTLRAWELAALLALCTALCAAVWAQARQNELSASVVRLHVIAVSDDEEEQAVKLRVRDEVVAYLTPLLRDEPDADAAHALLERELEGIRAAAERAAQGRSVRVELGPESYPTRVYEGFTLPAGRYDSLRVVLGEGEGHNWWCVVFPPLCLDASDAGQVKSVMSAQSYALVSEEEGYVLRFRLVELWGELMNRLER